MAEFSITRYVMLDDYYRYALHMQKDAEHTYNERQQKYDEACKAFDNLPWFYRVFVEKDPRGFSNWHIHDSIWVAKERLKRWNDTINKLSYHKSIGDLTYPIPDESNFWNWLNNENLGS